MSRRLLSFFLAVLVSIFFVLSPVNAVAATYSSFKIGPNAYLSTGALVPVARGAMTTAQVASKANPWGVAISVGLVLAEVAINWHDSNGNTLESIIRGNKAPRSVPPGWSSNPDDPSNPLAPSVAFSQGVLSTWWGGGNGDAPSADAACGSWNLSAGGVLNSAPIRVACLNSSGNQAGYADEFFSCDEHQTSAGYSGETCQGVTYCPRGYVKTSTNCVPQNLSGVPLPSEGIPYLQPKTDGSGFEADPRRPDVMPSSINSSGPIVINGVDANGNPTQLTITPTPSGIQMDHLQQGADASGNSVTQANHLTMSQDGTVTGLSQDTKPGAIIQYNTTNTTLTNTSAPSIQFPSDYARQGEADLAATKMKTGIDQLHNDLTQTSPSPTDPVVPGDSSYTDFGETFNGLTSWQVPGHASQCPTGSFDAFGKTFVVNSHCTLIETYWSAFQTAMMVVWVVLALFIVLRA